jgi:hypothetical protein
MKKASFRTNHREFDEWINWYGRFILKLLSAQRVVRYKVEKLELVEALIHRVTVRWEVLVTRDIIISLNRDSSHYAAALGLRLRKHLTMDECEAILTGFRYLDFKSVGDVKGFGKKYLVERLDPFRSISSTHSKAIDEFLTTRNCLAHYSRRSWHAYRHALKSNHGLRRIPEPGEFLVSVNRQTHRFRWDEYLQSFLGASEQMLNSVA